MTETTRPDASDLIPLTWEETVLVDAHKAALEKALESSDGACGAILTACFSLATAYGAVIALVAPKETQATLLVVSPFVLLAAGAVVALVGKASGISLDDFGTTDQVKDHVVTAVGTKRKASWGAVACAAAGVVLAGYVVFATYSEPVATDEANDIVFTPAGRQQVQAACGAALDSVRGDAAFARRWVTITLDDASSEECPNTDELVLPVAAVSYVRSAP